MTTADYLEQLQQDREDLVDNLETKGITGLTGDETFTELVPEVLNIPSGGGSAITDWSEIGYTDEPTDITTKLNYSKNIYDNWEPATNLSSKYYNNKSLVYMPLVDTSIATNTSYMLGGCDYLEYVPLLDTSSVTNMDSMFKLDYALQLVPLLDTSNVTNMYNMFYQCMKLTTVPQFNTSSVTNMSNMFQSCTNLSDNSLNNILAMCIGATSYTGTKKLSTLGITNGTLTGKIPNLSNYQDFIDAGWTIS